MSSANDVAFAAQRFSRRGQHATGTETKQGQTKDFWEPNDVNEPTCLLWRRAPSSSSSSSDVATTLVFPLETRFTERKTLFSRAPLSKVAISVFQIGFPEGKYNDTLVQSAYIGMCQSCHNVTFPVSQPHDFLWWGWGEESSSRDGSTDIMNPFRPGDVVQVTYDPLQGISELEVHREEKIVTHRTVRWKLPSPNLYFFVSLGAPGTCNFRATLPATRTAL